MRDTGWGKTARESQGCVVWVRGFGIDLTKLKPHRYLFIYIFLIFNFFETAPLNS